MSADHLGPAPGRGASEAGPWPSVQAAVSSPLVLAVTAVVAVAALTSPIGADFRWAGALGRVLLHTGTIPDGVPFATAPSRGWPNTTVAAEVITAGAMNALGDRGLYLLQVSAVAIAFAALARAIRSAGAGATGGAAALVLLAAGAFGAVAVARLQLFSLALFAVLLATLHARRGRSSRRLWALPPLFAIWANLHGGVLVGLGVAGLYLAFESLRRRPWETIGLAAASVGALFATPALLHAPAYYLGVMRSEAAVHGEGLWAPLTSSPLDLMLVAVAGLLAILAFRGRPRAWEVAAAVALAGLTVQTARSGVWLLMVLAVPAARGVPGRLSLRPLSGFAVVAFLCACIGYGLVRGPLPFGAPTTAVDAAITAAGSGPVLAQDVLAEQVAAAGGRIVLGNPLDAFGRDDQRLYLAWSSGRPAGDPLLKRARVLLVRARSGARDRAISTGRFRELERDGSVVVYVARAG
jgi:hypothetical protein